MIRDWLEFSIVMAILFCLVIAFVLVISPDDAVDLPDLSVDPPPHAQCHEFEYQTENEVECRWTSDIGEHVHYGWSDDNTYWSVTIRLNKGQVRLGDFIAAGIRLAVWIPYTNDPLIYLEKATIRYGQ